MIFNHSTQTIKILNFVHKFGLMVIKVAYIDK